MIQSDWETWTEQGLGDSRGRYRVGSKADVYDCSLALVDGYIGSGPTWDVVQGVLKGNVVIRVFFLCIFEIFALVIR